MSARTLTTQRLTHEFVCLLAQGYAAHRHYGSDAPTTAPVHLHVECSIDIAEWPLVSLSQAKARYLAPAAAAMVSALQQAGLTCFDPLDLPQHGCEAFLDTDIKTGIIGRGVSCYMPDQSYELEDGTAVCIPEHMALRFDVRGWPAQSADSGQNMAPSHQREPLNSLNNGEE